MKANHNGETVKVYHLYESALDSELHHFGMSKDEEFGCTIMAMATGELRVPKKGEYYLATFKNGTFGYRMTHDDDSPMCIAKLVKVQTVRTIVQ